MTNADARLGRTHCGEHSAPSGCGGDAADRRGLRRQGFSVGCGSGGAVGTDEVGYKPPGRPRGCYRMGMDVGTLVSVEEYLNTSYDPDVEYVDGVLVEPNVGDWLHSLVQRNIIVAFTVHYPEVYAVPELRSQTRTTRYRLPDVCVLLSAPKTKYLLE